MQAPIGLIDNPYQSRQMIYNLDLAADPVVALRRSGARQDDLPQILDPLPLRFTLAGAAPDLCPGLWPGWSEVDAKAMPHIGGIVDANEDERVERLLRMVRYTIDGRQAEAGGLRLGRRVQRRQSQRSHAAVLVVIDNVAEFKETYEHYLEGLIDLVKDGRSFGVYFVVTGDVLDDVPSKLFNVLGQRMTFNQLDPVDYSMIVGRGGIHPNNVPGRGLMVATIDGKPQPLEFHTAVPGGDPDGDLYRDLSDRMASVWESLVEDNPELAPKRAKPVEVLPEMIDLKTVLPAMGKGAKQVTAPIGVNDSGS